MQHLGTQELETERLLLCEFDKADFHEVFANWAGDRETTKFLTWQAHADETDTKRFLAEVTKNYWRDDYYHWKIMFGGEIVGSIEVTGADERSGHCELGWVIGKAWRGRGFMPEAASAVCAFLLEQVGYNPSEVFSTAHTGKYNHVRGNQWSGTLNLPDCTDTFHDYTLEWDEYSWRTYIDGKPVYAFWNEQEGSRSWPFDQEFHLILNLAIGGNLGGKQGIDNSSFPHTMEIDYVRVWQRR